MHSSWPRLAFGAACWRLTLLIFLIAELEVWAKLRHFAPTMGHRILGLIWFTPGMLTRSLAIALALTFLLALIVRSLVRPQVARWLSPPTDPDRVGGPSAFHLGSNEAVVSEIPARRVVGRSTTPGTLVRTSRRIWFFPTSWESEPWSLSLTDVREVRPTPAPCLAWGFIQGLPDRLELAVGPEVRESFVVAEPEHVLAWFETPRVPSRVG